VIRTNRQVTAPKALITIAGRPFASGGRTRAIFDRLVRSSGLFTQGVWVEPCVSLPREASIGRRLKAMARAWPIKALAANELAIEPCFALPFSYRRYVSTAQAMLYSSRVLRALHERPYWLWVNSVEPLATALAKTLLHGAQRVIVDLSDDFTAFEDPDPKAQMARLMSFVARADAVIAVNEHVASTVAHPRVHVFPNATDFQLFQRFDPAYRLGKILPKAPGVLCVGFIGGLNRGRVDEPLLDRLFCEFPDVVFLFVGPTNDPGLVSRISAFPNVRAFPRVPYEDVPSVVRALDVGIVPHLNNAHTQGNDLLKVWDYLAAGVPVLSTRCSNVERLCPIVRVAEGPDDFVRQLRELLAGPVVHDSRPGLELARSRSWDHTVPKLARWLRETLDGGADSVAGTTTAPRGRFGVSEPDGQAARGQRWQW
jgi:glycosyltransferase involved in cell wall biosynthesis